MAKRSDSAASRNSGLTKAVRWMLLASVGMIGGLVLGDFSVGGRLVPDTVVSGSFAELSANPDALTPDSLSAPPCIDCANSYAAAARLRARRAERMSHAFRDLGSVEIDQPVPEPDDDYRYGGRFPDPSRAVEDRVLPAVRPRPVNVAAPPAPMDQPGGEHPTRPATSKSNLPEPRADRRTTLPERLPVD
ncbi:hypothetical protein JI743_00830 [Sphingopyxis sp. DHUNG17]|uniref:hypothetical protein n=1 Tax=Sphingopyxis jiangsuensis TaxID=2871171 RepID=UPI00191D29A0|nr:hypothetical protein [Sphingopyxis lutea]MBL0767346.1 hypothetical protein [Sphingopyxis lutea]